MQEHELTRLVKIAKAAVANSETQALLGGCSPDFIADGIMSIAMRQRREGETPEQAFSRVTVEDPDARVLMKARRLTPTSNARAGVAKARDAERAQRMLDAAIARYRLANGGTYEAGFSAVTEAGEGKALLREIRGK